MEVTINTVLVILTELWSLSLHAFYETHQKNIKNILHNSENSFKKNEYVVSRVFLL